MAGKNILVYVHEGVLCIKIKKSDQEDIILQLFYKNSIIESLQEIVKNTHKLKYIENHKDRVLIFNALLQLLR